VIPFDEVRAVREGAGLFALERGVVGVRGADRLRFLQGQLSNDVVALDPAGPRLGCHALVLTPQGRIVAEVHVVARPDELWLETDLASVTGLVERLARYVIADRVELADRSAGFARLGIEGPRAREVVAEGLRLDVRSGAGAVTRVAGAEVVVAPFGWSGEDAYQLFLPPSAEDDVAAALRGAGAVPASLAALEILRVEAGRPRSGAELSQQSLPAEVGLVEAAVSFTKGCYTGQEVVARMHSRGRVGHHLVGLRLAVGEEEALPAPGAALLHDGARIGELTSAVRSPLAGAIALGFVRSGHHAPGTELRLDGRAVRIATLPFVTPRKAA
jgi:folate-binding protein YgfZ